MSFTSSFLHLDGVEFKLSETFQVSPIEGLPADFRIKDPTNLLLASEYDFTKERAALASIDAKRRSEQKMVEEEAERKRMSLRRREEKNQMLMDQQKEILQRQRELFLEQKRRQQQGKSENDKLSDRSSPEQASTSRMSPSSDESSEEKPPPIPPKTYFSQMKNDDILTPLPVTRKPQALTDPVATSSETQSVSPESVSTGQNQIWVDFEDKEQDPFTNMELKTIDDMKELQSVLQNVTPEPKNDLAIPSYQEATSNQQLYENVEPQPDESTTKEETPTVTSPSTSKPTFTPKPQYPLYADVAEISTRLKTIVMATENSQAPTSGQSPSSSSPTRLTRSPENKKGQSPDGAKEQEGGSPPQHKTTLYENIMVIENDESHFKFKTAEKIEGEKSSAIDDGVYDFAKDPPEIHATPLLPKAPIDPVMQQRLSPVSVMYGNLGKKEEVNADMYSKIVRPRRRAPKTPQGPPDSNSTSPPSPALLSPTNRAKPSIQNKPDATSSNWFNSGTEQSTPAPTGLNQSKPVVSSVTKVLPVSFGAVNSTVNTSILPPITSASSAESNINPRTSLSDSGLIQGPPIPPRRHLRGANTPTHGSTTFASGTSTVPPPIGTHLTQNGTTLSGTPLGAHNQPPYALPQKATPNGPTVAIKSNSAVCFSNQSTRPALPPRKTPSPGQGNSPKADATFIKKSLQDRARFEETMNRALSSLPKNPAMKPVIAHKPTSPPAHDVATESQPFSSYTPLPSTPRSPSPRTLLLQSLTTQERDFVNSITSMGFDTEATVRATRNLGCNAKEVVDHLIIVQRISEQGFSTKAVQDALEIYKEDKEITKYLHQASQLMDMGFPEGDVKNALVSHGNDQTKALDQLMGQT